jgi:hypothetical protein
MNYSRCIIKQNYLKTNKKSCMSKKAVRKSMRSGVKKCPISGYVGPLIEHHIHGREINDAESDWNKAWISPNVHDMIHQGVIIIEGWFMTSEGRTLIWRWNGDETTTGFSATPPSYDARLLPRSS